MVIVAGDGEPTGKQGEPGYSRRLANMPDCSIGIFGDSIIQATHENMIHPMAVNYALGGQSLRRMTNALTSFQFMKNAAGGVIACGVNDLSNITYYGPRDNHQAAQTVLYIFKNKLAPMLTGKWVICHLLPCDEIVTGANGYNAQVAEVNAGLAEAFSATSAQVAFAPVPAVFVDAQGNLKDEYHVDGQHLSKVGAEVFASSIKTALNSIGVI